jgi:hypothetical protein
MSEQTLVERLQTTEAHGQVTLTPEEMVSYGASVPTAFVDHTPLLRAAADRIEELEAIVEKLPKTADGVIVVPGMQGVWISPHQVTAGIRECFGGLEAEYDGDNGPEHMPFDQTYSTRAAAEAAKGAEAGKK